MRAVPLLSAHARSASLFGLVLLAHVYFAGALGWNQSSRFAGMLTFVEPGPHQYTLRIDEFVASDARNLQTGDWARGADGHFYANKAPGLLAIGIPVYAGLHALERALGLDVRAEPVTRRNAILVNLACTITWTAAASVMLASFLAASGLSRVDALLGAFAWAFGSLLFPYDASLWGHPTAAACVLAALCLTAWPGAPRAPALAGALAGFAVLTDYLAVFGAGAAGATLLLRRSRARDVLVFGGAAALPFALLLLYQRWIFGGFLTTASSQSNPVFLSEERAFGLIGMLDPAALPGLLVSAWRGLFFYCPVLAFSVAGAVQRWRTGAWPLVVASAAGFAALLAFVASAEAWWGGMASGPRYLITGLPLLAVLAPRVGALARPLRVLYGGALGVSVLHMLALTAVDPMIQEEEKNPLYGFALPRIASGSYPHLLDATNLGQALGLQRPWDLLLFAAVFGAWAVLLVRSARAGEPRS